MLSRGVVRVGEIRPDEGTTALAGFIPVHLSRLRERSQARRAGEGPRPLLGRGDPIGTRVPRVRRLLFQFACSASRPQFRRETA
jgi:hypothetical protein